MAYLRRSRATATKSISTAQMQDDAVTLAKMAGGTDGNIISYDASGDPAAVATGSSGQVLTSAGSGAPPTMSAVAAGGVLVGYAFYNGNGDTNQITLASSKTYYAQATAYHNNTAHYNTEVYKFVVDGTGSVTATQSVNVTGDFGPNSTFTNAVRMDTAGVFSYPQMLVWEGTGVDES